MGVEKTDLITSLGRLKFITEPWSDVSHKINGNTELTSGADVTVSIYVEPTKKKLINKNRYFYVMAEHPDIVWEIPIIVVGNSPEVFIPELICLPRVPANTISTYQFVIYNPLENDISFGLNTKYAHLTISPISGNILAKDYCKILLSAKIPIQAMTAGISATFTNGKSNSSIVRMEPSDQLIHLSTSILTFEDTYMGLRTQQNIQICNKSMESVNFRWSCCADPQDTTKSDADEELIISEFFRIRNKRGCIPPMNSALSIVTFCPPYDYNYNDEDEPPFNVNIIIYLFCPMLGSKSYKLQINGNILGPRIEINPKDIDLGNIYMGQMQCLTFDVTNKGPIPGTIYCKEHTDQNEIRCLLAPLSMVLEPNSGGLFQLSFYRRDIGKFLTKLTFKSKYGNSLSVLLRGTCLAAKVKIWPELFEFGNIPICIPQKRYALVSNPLPVPIVVEPMVVDDGVEDPMILSVDYSKLPLHARPATYYNMKCCCKSRFEAVDDEELKPSYSDFGSDRRESDATSTNSQLSTMFQNKVLDDIPKMAEELLQNVKTLLPQSQPEPGMQIIDVALDCIFYRSDYFEDLKDKQNYLNMDWDALPCDAKEVAIEAERFFLKPGESKTFPVVLIPNSVGPCTKSIQFKACPMGIEHSELKTAIRSKYMVNTLHLQYKCAIPALECNDSVQFLTPLYVDMENSFQMKFRNIDVIPGFVYFKVIPKSAIGVMKVVESQRKFFIAPNDEIDVSCSVIFRKVGTITLHGMFQLIGKLMEYPFKLEAEVIPPRIQINPEKLTNKQQVLKMTRTRVFLENICPTVAQFSLSLKNDNHQFLEPLGGSLAPNQKILISIFSRYKDPGIYKNVVYLYLKHVGKISIPLTFIIEGAPLQFEPNIKLGLNFGNIFKTDASQNHLIKITNFGEKSYRLLFLKQKPKTTLLPVSVFNIQPNGVTLAPKAEGSINISLDSSKEVCAEEEYLVDVMGEDNCRLKLCTFTTRCNVIKSKVVWNRNSIYLETGNPNKSSNKICDTAIITNTTPLKANVVLNVIGCFVICNTLTGPMEKSLHFCLEGKAGKEFTISLNEDEIEALDMCQCLKGFIKCKVNNKAQKPLLLHAKIVHPGLRICPPQVAFLAKNIVSYSHINVHNCSPLRARFAWKHKTIAHTKSTTQKNKELSYSKTISEIILSSAEGVVLNISEIGQLKESEICLCDEEFLDDDLTNPRNSSVSSRSERSEIIIGKPSQYKSLAVLSHKDEKPPFDINEIFDFLKLPRLTQATVLDRGRDLDGGDRKDDEKNIQELEKIEPVVFQQMSGFILPKTMFKAYMFLPPVPEGDTLITKFDLEVIGGRTESLEVTITSINGRIRISKTEIDLGRQIWQKTTTGTIKLTNVCQYAVKIALIQSTADGHYLTEGHVEIISPKMFIIMPEASASIEWKALLGLRYHFIEDIGVEINNNRTPIPIRFYGKGLMPMIAPVNLNKITPSALDNVKSFLAIHSVFRDFQMQKESPNQIDSSSINDELTLDESKLSSSLTLNEEEIQSNTNHKKRSRRNERNQHVTLNYSKETGPERMVVEQLIETWKLIDELNQSKELKKKFDQFYLNCLSAKAESEPVINLKLIICRPIPWELPVYALNIGEINVDEIKTYEIDLIFLGPGKIFVSARTQTIIPGLVVWFENFQRTGCPNSFVSFEQTPDDKTLTIYRNVRERAHSIPNQEAVVELKHAHSYDLDDKNQHRRKNSPEKKKQIKEHYTVLSQPFKEKKNPLIRAEMCQTTEAHLDHSRLKVVLRLEALSQFYDNDQLIEDYLLIDMHLGPTLPILLQGRVAKNMTTKI